MKLPIYFDYASTTPVDPRVVEKMQDCLSLDGNFGNPASRSHAFGWKAEEAIDCLLYTSPSPRDVEESRMPSSA